jgi:aminodeoxyfutalosine synthase
MSTEDLCQLITAVGRTPVERDTVYNEIKTYSPEMA